MSKNDNLDGFTIESDIPVSTGVISIKSNETKEDATANSGDEAMAQVLINADDLAETIKNNFIAELSSLSIDFLALSPDAIDLLDKIIRVYVVIVSKKMNKEDYTEEQKQLDIYNATMDQYVALAAIKSTKSLGAMLNGALDLALEAGKAYLMSLVSDLSEKYK